MSGIDALLDHIPIPPMARVRQIFERPTVDDPAAECARLWQAAELTGQIRKGADIAVAVGSRGIAKLPAVVGAVVAELRKAGARPFIVPAMGSHGGATAAGQKALLARLGVDEASVGAPVRSTMEVVQVAMSPRFGMPVYVDALAQAADGIVVINRIKAHPAFSGDFESGLLKMVVIGLGKQRQAEVCHNIGAERIGEFITDIGLEALHHLKLIAAVGIVENAFHETARIAVMGKDGIEPGEPQLLAEAKRLAARFLIDEFDALIIDEIGKDISGAGFDTHIVGRYSSPYLSGGPRIRRVAVLDITAKSKGYGGGLGMVDFTTRRAFEKFDAEETYPNTLTSTFTNGVKIPMILKNDRQAIQACIRTCNQPDLSQARVIRIKNTLCMEQIDVSTSLLDQVRQHPDMRIEGEPQALEFDGQGNLFRG
jgi:hypothetical protein